MGNAWLPIPNLFWGDQRLTLTGSEEELVLPVHNHINRIHEALGLQPDGAVVVEQHMQSNVRSER